MQNSNDSIIFQLTNIGAAQRDSPVRTPKKCVTPINEPLTPPPSSKGKRWAEKLPGFPRSSERRKKSVNLPSGDKGSIASHSIAISPPMASGRTKTAVATSEPDGQYPSRTDSLPRPQLKLQGYRSRDGALSSSSAYSAESLRRMQPPRVLPFGYSDARVSPKKSFLNCVCTVCDEPIFTRSHGERIIELECGHISHQECLLISFEASYSLQSDEFADVFPHCNKCREEYMKDVKCLPKNIDLKDKLISEFLINKNLGSPGGIRSRPSAQVQPRLQSFLSSPAVITTKQELRQVLAPPIVRSAKSAFQVPLVSDGSARSKRLQSTPQAHQVRKGSPWVASSSVVSSANDLSSIISADVSVSDRSQRTVSERTQLPILRAFYMEILLANFKSEIVDWKVDAVYGLLRLVDKLFMSRDGSSYSTCLCYLFEKALIVATLSNEDLGNLINTKLTNLQTFAPVARIRVEAVDASIFKCTIPSDAGYQELYLTEKLNASSSQIIQKWISGLLNHDFVFDESNFTSTLPIPPIIRQVKGRADRESHIGMVGSSKVIELSGLDQLSDSVIIRRGVRVPPMSADAGDNLETMETAMTTISSILSLKREKPNDLIVVLQYNFEDGDFKNSRLTIYNSMKALGMKFNALKVCIVDADGYVVKYGLAKEIFTSPESTASLKKDPIANKFDPQWLKNAFHPTDMLRNAGIAVISATSMEVGRSCLLMDYKSFTCIGRRRPNELKVKVGYLNVDYSDSIEELVEVATWANVLEALSYSFSLMFGDDEDEESSGIDSSDNEMTLSTRVNLSRPSSVLNFKAIDPPIARSCDEDANEGESPLFGLREEIMSAKRAEPGRSGSLSAKRAEKGWDPLLDDIESAIRELQRGRSASPGRQSSLYTYL